MKRYTVAVLCAAGALICGCQVSSTFNADMMEPSVKRIAVAPFQGPEEPPFIKDMVRRSIHNNLCVLGFADMKLGEVDYRLEQAGIAAADVGPHNADAIAKAIGADAVLFGTIRKTSNVTAVVYSETQIKGEFILVNARTSQTIWQATHGDGQRGGLLLDALHVMETIEDQCANSMKEEAYQRAADKLARKVIATLPDVGAERIAQAPLPQIQSIQSNADGRGLATGQQVVVVVKGTPGMTATMNLYGMQDYIPLTEAPAGVYTGAYRIGEDTKKADGRIVCRLQDRNGNVGQKTARINKAFASK
ncbi:MAG: GNA1162 family protein [Planctomycetota bacterium]